MDGDVLLYCVCVALLERREQRSMFDLCLVLRFWVFHFRGCLFFLGKVYMDRNRSFRHKSPFSRELHVSPKAPSTLLLTSVHADERCWYSDCGVFSLGSLGTRQGPSQFKEGFCSLHLPQCLPLAHLQHGHIGWLKKGLVILFFRQLST